MIAVSNTMCSDQAWHSVGSDLCTNCLQRLLADERKHLKRLKDSSSNYYDDYNILHVNFENKMYVRLLQEKRSRELLVMRKPC